MNGLTCRSLGCRAKYGARVASIVTAMMLAVSATACSSLRGEFPKLGPVTADGPGPSRHEESAQRTRDEQVLAENRSRISSLMLGGAMNALLTRGARLLLQCQIARFTLPRHIDCKRLLKAPVLMVAIYGAADGYLVALRERKGQNERAALAQMLEDARRDNEQLRAHAAVQRRVILEGRKRIRAAKASGSSQSRRVVAAREQENLENMKVVIEDLDKMTKTYREAARQLRQKRSATQARRVESEVRRMEAETQKLRAAVADYAKEVGTVTSA